ncbi:LCP family protein [Lutibacter sp. B2]|nr:LCP family protein [Lutibacter sp. B2]
MKTFLKVFCIAFICFMVAMSAGVWGFSKYYSESDSDASIDSEENKEDIKYEEFDNRSELKKMMDESKRINVLLLGMEGPRTDTIIFASFDPESKNVDLVSIPRDTYYERRQYRDPAEQKINAVYGDDGVEGITKAVRKVLGDVPIHYYASVTYKGVERIVDSLGGVEVNIPMNMKYDDPYDKPPLHIDFKKGPKVLNGKTAIQFLRFRKGNNGGGYPDGDLGRNKAQQEFIKSALGKALGFRLPVVANTVVKYVKTDIPLSKIASIAKDAVGMKRENVKTYSIPGKAVMQNRLSYFMHDKDQIEELTKEIYSGGKYEKSGE